MTRLLGREVKFVPACCMVHANGRPRDEVVPIITGRVVSIHKGHGWFMVRWKAGQTIQHECFKLFDIGKDVLLLGNKKNR